MTHPTYLSGYPHHPYQGATQGRCAASVATAPPDLQRTFGCGSVCFQVSIEEFDTALYRQAKVV
jgi:hypothetical protein